jgi:hypothetical protein
MRVYVLTHGEDYEGETTLGVFTSPEHAKLGAFDDNIGLHRTYGEWTPREKCTGDRYVQCWEQRCVEYDDLFYCLTEWDVVP